MCCVVMVLGLRATGFAVRGNRHTDATNGTDERGAPRRRTLTGGKIVYGDGAYTYDCTIREISASGARIGIAGGIVIPRAFFLIDQKRGTAFEAVLVWRNGTQAGLKFRAAHDLVHLADPQLRFLRDLYAASHLRPGTD